MKSPEPKVKESNRVAGRLGEKVKQPHRGMKKQTKKALKGNGEASARRLSKAAKAF
jgi:hypothetical protein